MKDANRYGWMCDYCNEVTEGAPASSTRQGGGFTRLCGCEVPEQMCHSCAESYAETECRACERAADEKAERRADKFARVGRAAWGVLS